MGCVEPFLLRSLAGPIGSSSASSEGLSYLRRETVTRTISNKHQTR